MSRRIIQIEIKHDLLVLFGLILVVLVNQYVLHVHALRVILGLLYLLFIPGYTLLAALYPGRDELQALTRTALSFALSIPILSLLGLLLHYTPWGIRLEPTLVATGLFVLVCSGVALARRSKLSPEDQFSIHFQFDVSYWQSRKLIDKALSVALVLSVLSVVAALVYGISRIQPGERFTEFYIVGADGLVGYYPQEITAGEPVSLVIGIVNREHADVQYRVELDTASGRTKIANPHLEREETWEQFYTFTLAQPGADQRIGLLLYKQGETEPYRSLHLWITVTVE